MTWKLADPTVDKCYYCGRNGQDGHAMDCLHMAAMRQRNAEAERVKGTIIEEWDAARDAAAKRRELIEGAYGKYENALAAERAKVVTGKGYEERVAAGKPDPLNLFGPPYSPADVTKPTNPKDAVGGLKFPMSYVPAPVLAEVAVGMAEGGHKYGRHNYRVIVIRASVYYDAAMRHLMQWWEGEDLDPDSNLSHITKAITSLVVLRDAMIQGKFSDDRPPKSKPWAEGLNMSTKALDIKYPEKKASYTELK